MNTAVLRAELEAIKARCDAAIAAIEQDGDGPSKWRTIAEYAKHANVHAETVRQWIRLGMPATDVKHDGHGKVTGVRRTTRINIDDADAWRLRR